MRKASKIFLCVSLCLVASILSVSSLPSAEQRVFQVDNKRLVEVGENEIVWADPDELIQADKKFMDVTDHPDLAEKAAETRQRHELKHDLPESPRYEDVVNLLLKKINVGRMKERLTKLTSFQNRYYKSKTGVQSATWLENVLKELVSSHCPNVVVEEFSHSWPQFSLIARFPGNQKESFVSEKDKPVVIVGSHQDTVRGGFFQDGVAPGADDDGSGTVTTLEAFTILCESGFEPHFPVEFHFYSAEEVGLRGSQDIAAHYQQEERNVLGMIQFDLTGYKKRDIYGIVTDFVDPELTEFLKMLARAYGKLQIVETKCNYGCSDHASWNKAGFRSAIPFEGTFEEHSPFIHTKDDTVANIDFQHMKQFVKLALAFAVELSGE